MEVVSGDNWSYKSCKAPVKSSPTTNPPVYNTRSPTGAATADAAMKQALMYSIPVKTVKRFRPASSSAVSETISEQTYLDPVNHACHPSGTVQDVSQATVSDHWMEGFFIVCGICLLLNAYIMHTSCLLTYFLIVTRYRQWHLTCFCYAIKSFFLD